MLPPAIENVIQLTTDIMASKLQNSLSFQDWHDLLKQSRFDQEIVMTLESQKLVSEKA